MAISSEEQRALDFQRTLENRARAKQQAELALRGDPTRRQALEAAWSPVTRRDDTFTPTERRS